MRPGLFALPLALGAVVACASPGPQPPAPVASGPSTASSTPPPAPGPAVSAQAPAADSSGGTQTHCAETVVATSTTEPAGLKEENRWLREHYPGWRKAGQALSAPNKDGKIFDYVDIESAAGGKKTICFDITSYFGKW